MYCPNLARPCDLSGVRDLAMPSEEFSSSRNFENDGEIMYPIW